MKIEEFKKLARDKFTSEEIVTSHKDPISLLYSLSWNVPDGPAFPEEEIVKMNMNLDERGCFGRALKGAVIAEKLFPEHILYAGEVCNDLLRTFMLEGATPEKWNDETFISELLQYENPHIALVDEAGNQFDPIFKELTLLPKKLRHPAILKHTLWEGLHCAYMVSQAALSRETNVLEYVRILEETHSLYPEVILVKENLASAYCLVDQYEKAIFLAKEVSLARKDARALLFLWLLTNEEVYQNQIIEEYDEKLFLFLTKNF